MSRQSRNQWVIGVSALLGLFGLADGIIRVTRGHSFGFVALLLLSYGGVFIAVLPMNWIGQQAARLRAEKDDRVQPPARPRPVAQRAQRTVSPVALEAPYVRLESVRLQRVTDATQEAFQSLLDACVTEVLALQDEVPAVLPDGHLASNRADHLRTQSHVFLFLIQYEELPIGAMVLNACAETSIVELVYVESAWRRRGIAGSAFSQLVQFVHNLYPGSRIVLLADESNARAVAFGQAVGLHRVTSAAGEAGAWPPFALDWPRAPEVYLVNGAEDSN